MTTEARTPNETSFPFSLEVLLKRGNQVIIRKSLGIRAGKCTPDYAQIVVAYDESQPVTLTAEKPIVFKRNVEGPHFGLCHGKLRPDSEDELLVPDKYRVTVISTVGGLRLKVEANEPLKHYPISKIIDMSKELNRINGIVGRN